MDPLPPPAASPAAGGSAGSSGPGTTGGSSSAPGGGLGGSSTLGSAGFANPGFSGSSTGGGDANNSPFSVGASNSGGGGGSNVTGGSDSGAGSASGGTAGSAGANGGATSGGNAGAASGGTAPAGGVSGSGGVGNVPETCPPPLEFAPLVSVYPLENSCWKTRASACAPNVAGGNSPGYALDGDLDTRFSTGSYMNAGTAFEYRIDLRSLVNVERVTLTSKADDWARELSVYASADGVTWHPVACGPGAVVTDFWFEMTAARYLKFIQGGSGGGWWSLHEIVVYGEGENTCERYVGPRDPGTCDSIHFNN